MLAPQQGMRRWGEPEPCPSAGSGWKEELTQTPVPIAFALLPWTERALSECPSMQIPKDAKCYYHIIIVLLMHSAEKDPHRANWMVSGYSKLEIRCHFYQMSFCIFSH